MVNDTRRCHCCWCQHGVLDQAFVRCFPILPTRRNGNRGVLHHSPPPTPTATNLLPKATNAKGQDTAPLLANPVCPRALRHGGQSWHVPYQVVVHIGLWPTSPPSPWGCCRRHAGPHTQVTESLTSDRSHVLPQLQGCYPICLPTTSIDHPTVDPPMEDAAYGPKELPVVRGGSAPSVPHPPHPTHPLSARPPHSCAMPPPTRPSPAQIRLPHPKGNTAWSAEPPSEDCVAHRHTPMRCLLQTTASASMAGPGQIRDLYHLRPAMKQLAAALITPKAQVVPVMSSNGGKVKEEEGEGWRQRLLLGHHLSRLTLGGPVVHKAPTMRNTLF
jgi:hypothetical protein